MSVRNNEDRFGARNSGTAEVPMNIKEQMASALDYVTPTEHVDLPSRGRGYPQNHPLCGQETIEIRFMTAKDEDILTSRSLLKKGIALDRLINNLIVNKAINSKDLLVGDRNAIIIKARSSAYGNLYETSITCPACSEKTKCEFDLEDPKVNHGDDWGDKDIQLAENGNYLINLPYSNILVEVRLLNGYDEMAIIKKMNSKNKNQLESMVTDQMRLFIVSVNGDASKNTINYFVNNVVAQESRYLRNAFKAITPDTQISEYFECPSCGHEQELEVPFGADFFWPDR